MICLIKIYAVCKRFWSLVLNPIALRKAKIVFNFGLFECKRVKVLNNTIYNTLQLDLAPPDI